MLETLIPSRLRRDVLALFFSNPETEYHIREVARRVKSPTNAVQAELERLAGAGILKKVGRANLVCFSVDRASPIFPELRGLVLKTAGIAGAVREALGKVDGIRFAFIYGSFAAGTEKPGSDVDVFVVGNTDFSGVTAAARKVEKRVGREVSVTVYPEKELRAKKDSGFVRGVFDGRKVWLMGDEREFERLVKQSG